MFLHIHWTLQKESKDLKRPLGLKADNIFCTKNDKLRRGDKTKYLGLGSIL